MTLLTHFQSKFLLLFTNPIRWLHYFRSPLFYWYASGAFGNWYIGKLVAVISIIISMIINIYVLVVLLKANLLLVLAAILLDALIIPIILLYLLIQFLLPSYLPISFIDDFVFNWFFFNLLFMLPSLLITRITTFFMINILVPDIAIYLEWID